MHERLTICAFCFIKKPGKTKKHKPQATGYVLQKLQIKSRFFHHGSSCSNSPTTQTFQINDLLDCVWHGCDFKHMWLMADLYISAQAPPWGSCSLRSPQCKSSGNVCNCLTGKYSSSEAPPQYDACAAACGCKLPWSWLQISPLSISKSGADGCACSPLCEQKTPPPQRQQPQNSLAAPPSQNVHGSAGALMSTYKWRGFFKGGGRLATTNAALALWPPTTLAIPTPALSVASTSSGRHSAVPGPQLTMLCRRVAWMFFL